VKVKWGAIVVEGRGKLGGHVASNNSAGPYFRTKVTPINPRTTSQEVVRARFAQLSQAWRNLSVLERSSWNSAVGDFAKTDVFGDLRTPSGFNLFQRLNNNLLNVGQSTIDSPPLSSVVVSTDIVTLFFDQGDNSEGTLTMSAAVPATSALEVWLTRGLSPGRSFAKSDFRLIQVAPPLAIAQVDFLNNYRARLGNPAFGSRVFAQAKFIDIATGIASPIQQIDTIVLSQI
jgi:hypothetical protein